LAAASSLPIPPLLPSEREATNRTPTNLLGDFDSLGAVDFDKNVKKTVLSQVTDEKRIGSVDVHHTLTDIFPSAQLPYDASEVSDPPRITSPMCLRDHPVHREQRPHNGTDLSWGPGVEGKRILAPYEGTVVYSNKTRPVDELGDAGYYLVIYHGESENNNRVYTRYLHLQENSIRLNAGNRVETGQYIGKVGNTGLGTNAHLHYEIRLNMQEPFWNPTGNAIPAFVYRPGRGGNPPDGGSSLETRVTY
jgi:murein DD-endopeptidase MepM/ murein hydrolase activator NlpD